MTDPITLARPEPTKRLIGLAPLIDVVFILLVFFMLASSFLDWHVVDLSIPTQNANATASEDKSTPVLVGLRVGGTIEVDRIVVPDTGVVAAVENALSEDATRPVIILVDTDVPVQDAIAMLERLAEGGINGVSLSKMQGAE